MGGRRLHGALGALFTLFAFTRCLGDPLTLVDPTPVTDASIEHEPSDTPGASDADADSESDGSASDASDGYDSEADAVDSGCGKDCLGGDCIAGKCQPLLLAPNLVDNTLPTGIAVDPAPSGGVFFTTYLGAQVRRAEKDGSGVTVITSFPWMHSSLDVAFDNHRLYVTTYNASGPSPVYSMNDDGSDKAELGNNWFYGPWLVSFDSNYVYWANRWDSAYITRAPKAGGSSEIVYQPNPSDAGTAQPGGWAVRVDGTSLFWSVEHHVAKRQANNTVTEIAPETAYDIAFDSSYVYWAAPNMIRRRAKDGSGGIEDLVSGPQIGRILLDGGYIYWTDNGNPGGVWRKKLVAGSAKELLVGGLKAPHGIAADARAIYFAEQQAGQVWKLAK